MTCADFDGVVFHMWTPPEDKTTLNLSLQASAFATINKYGLQARLKQIYGPYLAATTEQGFNATLTVNTAQLPANSGTFSHTPTHSSRSAALMLQLRVIGIPICALHDSNLC